MNSLLINTDIGERGIYHPTDIALMDLTSIANIACGGHAGDAASASFFRALAGRKGVQVTAHLSYPDKANFGRLSMPMPFAKLQSSLSEQLALLPGIHAVKFHGALYNDAAADPSLANALANWLLNNRITSVITLPESELSSACRAYGIPVMHEAFAERRYAWSTTTHQLSLLARSHPLACITDCQEALAQVSALLEKEQVQAFVLDESPTPSTRWFPVTAQTICIHSDSAIALDLARGLAARLKRSASRPETLDD